MSSAFILINCEPNSASDVKEKINEIPEIEDAGQVFGAYDCIVKTKDMPHEKIRDIISEKIRPIEKVRTTLTLPVDTDIRKN